MTHERARTSVLKAEASGLATLVSLTFVGAAIELWAFIFAHGITP